jgi:hypothetical protein
MVYQYYVELITSKFKIIPETVVSTLWNQLQSLKDPSLKEA